jgi:hypothetical protein
MISADPAARKVAMSEFEQWIQAIQQQVEAPDAPGDE